MMRKLPYGAMTIFALMIAAYAFALLAVPAMRPPFLRDRFQALPFAVVTHLFASAVALAAGPVQFNSRLRARSYRLHRWLGRSYVIGVTAGGVAGLILAAVSQGGAPAHVGFGTLAVVWVGTTLTAYRRIRAGDEVGHRRWMTRSYALTLAAVTLRVYLPLSLIAGVPFEPVYQAISWLCWVPNLMIAEWLIRRAPAMLTV
jgi:uncharacterized membrane protein